MFIASADRLLPHIGMEGQPAARDQQRLDALGVICGQSHGAAASDTARGDDRGRRRSVDAMHVQRQTTLSDLPHAVQHGRRGCDDAGDGHRVRVAWRDLASDLGHRAGRSDPRHHRHVFPHQYRARRRSHRIVHRSVVWKVWRDDFLWSGPSFIVAGSAGAIAAHRDRARRSLAGHPDAGAGLSHLSHVLALPRPHRGRAPAQRRDPQAARRGGRGAHAGEARRAGSRERKGAARRHAAKHRRRRHHDGSEWNNPAHQQRGRSVDRMEAARGGGTAAVRGVSKLRA